MQNSRKLGIILIIISVMAGVLFYTLTQNYYEHGKEMGCYLPQNECKEVQSSITLTHIAFGVVAFLLSLGFYMLVFHRTEEDVLKKLEAKEKQNVEDRIKQEKLNIILSLLSEEEQKVLKSIKEQDGITQSTLRIRTGLSKTKLSQILIDFEKKNLIKREESGKTLSIHLKKDI